MKAQALDHLVLTVADVEASAGWYGSVLGMRRSADERGRTSVHFGRHKINLRPVGARQDDWFTGRAPAPGSADLCVLVDVAPEAVVAQLAAHAVAIELGPVIKQGARGPIHSVYCRDPDGNLIELASYPPS